MDWGCDGEVGLGFFEVLVQVTEECNQVVCGCNTGDGKGGVILYGIGDPSVSGVGVITAVAAVVWYRRSEVKT